MKKIHRKRLENIIRDTGRLKAHQIATEACEVLYDLVPQLLIVEGDLRNAGKAEAADRVHGLALICTGGLRSLPSEQSDPLMGEVVRDVTFDLKAAIAEAAKKVGES